MLKRFIFPAAALAATIGYPVVGYPVYAQQLATIPTTAASFPREAIPATAGTIDFWAKLSGFSGPISSGPAFLSYDFHDGRGNNTRYMVWFSGNDGAGNRGLIGAAGNHFAAGSRSFFDPGDEARTYEDVLGAGSINTWHHYQVKWDEKGLTGLPHSDPASQKVAVYLDGVLDSANWGHTTTTFPPLTAGTLNLIASHGSFSGRVAIDELRIFDGNHNLLLYNTFDSIQDIEHSAAGLNGSFNGYGRPMFVPGVLGNALEATPSPDLAMIPEPETYAMLLAGLGVLGSISRRRRRI